MKAANKIGRLISCEVSEMRRFEANWIFVTQSRDTAQALKHAV